MGPEYAAGLVVIFYAENPVETILSILYAPPAIVRVFVVFGLILIMIHRRWSLGSAFMAGAFLMGLLFGMGPFDIVPSAMRSLIHPRSLGISAVVGLILILSHSLETTKQMERLLAAFSGLVRRPLLNLALFPALIGLLPMPGGAVFSAPMVKHLGVRYRLKGSQLSFINYWFRHIWEYWWPLYPGVLMTIALAHIDLWEFVMFTLPLTAVAILVGYWPLRRVFTVDERTPPEQTTSVSWRPFLSELFPIAFVIIIGLGAGLVLTKGLTGNAQHMAKELGMIGALVLAIGWIWYVNGLNGRSCLLIIAQPALIKMLFMVAGIFVFKGILQDSGAVNQIGREFIQWHIPLISIAILMPFIVGVSSGITIAFVGATFPILISLVQTMDQGPLIIPYLILATVSGYTGVLVSPLHLCMLLSNQYFETDLMSFYRLLLFPLFALVLSGCLYFGVLIGAMPN